MRGRKETRENMVVQHQITDQLFNIENTRFRHLNVKSN